jgi:hypothetical protein
VSASWHNWSRSVAAQPRRIEAPRSEDELASIVRESPQIRAVADEDGLVREDCHLARDFSIDGKWTVPARQRF